MCWRGREQPDRAHAEVLQDLRAESDLAPLTRARGFRRALLLRQRLHRHAGGAVAQHHDDAAADLLEARERRVDAFPAAEHVGDDVGAMQPRRHVRAVADAPVHQRHVINLVERRHEGIALERADRGLDRELADALDQLLARLPVGDQLVDRNLLELVLLGEGLDLRPAHHRAVVVDELADHADRLEFGEPAEIDRGFGVAGAHQHAAVLGDQRKHMAGAHEVGGARIVVGEIAHGRDAIVGRDAGGGAVLVVDRHREGGAVRRVVLRHHRREAQPVRELARHRRADDAGGVADDERHLLRRRMHRGHHEIALVLAVVVVGDDDDLAAREGFDGGCHTCLGVGHGFSNGQAGPSPTCALCRR